MSYLTWTAKCDAFFAFADGDLVSGPFVANVFFSSAVLSGPDAFPALTPPLCTPPSASCTL